MVSDKTMAHDYIAHIGGIDQPDYITLGPQFDDICEPLTDFMKKHQKIIVKPHNSFQGRGLSRDVHSLDEACEAVKKASKESKYVLVQEKVSGEEYRFITVNGKTKAVLMRKKASIVGDDKRTVSDLIKQENLARKEIVNSIVEYPQLDDSIIDKSLINNNEILERGQILELSQSTMIRGGASMYSVIDMIHPSFLDVANQIAQGLGDGLLCIDLMIEDATKPVSETSYHFIEINLIPSIPMCYSCRDGKHITILESYIGPMILDKLGISN
jgi:D-alanine-D-alanine ligase-like ATP-grasp enzyme